MAKQVVNRTDDSYLGRALRKIIMREKNEIGCRDFENRNQQRTGFFFGGGVRVSEWPGKYFANQAGLELTHRRPACLCLPQC